MNQDQLKTATIIALEGYLECINTMDKIGVILEENEGREHYCKLCEKIETLILEHKDLLKKDIAL